MSKEYIAYIRVSTERQGQSGLGLEAQREAIQQFLAAQDPDGKVIAEYQDVESGSNDDRPELAKAIEASRKRKATLLIAKLDRLARKVSFISGLYDSGVDFRAADLPTKDEFMLNIYASVAQEERRKISQRTKAALAAAKNRGVQLGNPNLDQVRERGAQANRERAEAFAGNVLPVVRELRKYGITSNAGIARALNARGVPTARGGDWHPATVRNLMKMEGAQ